MALRIAYRYVAEASDHEGRRLGELALDPDFAPAAEWSHLQGVRCNTLPPSAHHGPGVIEPVFDEALRRPYLTGIRVCFDAQDATYQAPLIPWSYFQPSVEACATRLVRDGRLQVDKSFFYRICAFSVVGGPPSPATASSAVVDETPVPLAMESASLALLVAQAERLSSAAWNTLDFPLFVQPAVLEEAAKMALVAGERETGGILVGHLRRDGETPEVHAEITAQIPATQTHAGRTHLGFTARTWSAVSDALALRGRDEIMLGWWHYHPDFCRRCDPARRRLCPLPRPFFSRNDCELHRTVFDTAFSVALLLSDVGEKALRCDWFGWRYGGIVARGCYLLPDDNPSIFYTRADEDMTSAARVLSVQENLDEY